MPTLYLKCKTCEIEFASGFAFDKKSFETTVLSENQHRCPKNHNHVYDKIDYYFKSEGSEVKYKNFSVTNFRMFKDISLSNFKRINLIAGRNNTGKTSLLESIYLHGGSFNPALTISIEGYRGITSWAGKSRDEKRTPWDNLFHNLDNEEIIEMISYSHDDKIEKTRIYLEENPSIDDYPDPIVKDRESISLIPKGMSHTITVERELSGIKSKSYLRIEKGGMKKIPPLSDAPFQLLFHAARLRLSPKVDTDRFSRSQIEGNKDMIIEAIGIVDDRIKDIVISTIGDMPSLYVDIGLNRYMPLLAAGEGTVKITQILLEMEEARNGIIFIDEFENGFHHSILPKIWDTIYRLSELFNIQVFATTHSIEAIKAAHIAFSEKDDYAFKLYRLEKIKDEISVISYEKDELEAAIELELEVR